MNFNKFELNENILKSLENSNYINASAIQEQVIPKALEGFDIVAQAQTGSGKTASFVLPILQKLSFNDERKKQKIKVLVLTPTRELTLQVASTFLKLSRQNERKLRVASLIGGEDISKQLLFIQKGCDVVVATSGRLLDIISKGQINLNTIEFFVLDEADKMLNSGFEEELDSILEVIPKNRQNLMFSATYPLKIKELVNKISNVAIDIKIEQTLTVSNINQRAIQVNKENRSALLKVLLKKNKYSKVLVFMANKKQSDNVAYKFRKNGFLAESFHGDLNQEDRSYTLNAFKNKQIKILFSTDIASRGLDINNVDCVINFDLPRRAEDYVHRIGRTARAGKKGDAISFITHENLEHFKLIQKRCEIDLNLEQIEGFELTGEIITKQKGLAPTKGKRKSKKDKLREAKNGN